MHRAWGVVLLVGLAGCDYLLGLNPLTPPKPPVDAAPPPPNAWSAVAGGLWHTCALQNDQTLWCWGRNDSLQIDPGNIAIELDTPTQVGSDKWTAISAANFHTCGIRSDGTLWCWGENPYGQLGTGDDSPQHQMVQIQGTWKAVGTGYEHTCAIDHTGALWCWGDDDNYQLGDNAPQPGTPKAPEHIDAGPWVEVTSGNSFSLGIKGDGTLWCWGADYTGQCGLPTGTDLATPTQVNAASWLHVVAGETEPNGSISACGIQSDGTLWCWGAGDEGQLGNGDTNPRNVPVEVAGHQTWTAVGVGIADACAVRADNGSLWCWGMNEYGELLTDTMTDSFKSAPVQVTGGGAKWTSLGVGGYHTCAIDDQQGLWCGGHAGVGQTATLGSHTQPTQITGTWANASAGSFTTCARNDGGATLCWGENDHGSVGDGTTLDRNAPTSVSGNAALVTLAVSDHVCAIDSSSAVWCWGYNGTGAVGNSTTTDQLAPYQTDLISIVAIAVSDHSCAEFANNAIDCWGANDQGQDGVSSAAVTYPTPVPGAYWAGISTGSKSTCAIATDSRSVWCWGYDAYDEYGNGTNTLSGPTPSMVQLPTGLWQAVYSGAYFNCAASAPQVYCWGADGNGELGNQTVTTFANPFATATDSVAFSAGFDHACSITSTGTLWCTGGNAFGQLGLGTFDDQHELTQVGTDGNWQSVTAGYQHTCATKTDGTLWCWGRDDRGQLGDGSAWTSMPTRIP